MNSVTVIWFVMTLLLPGHEPMTKTKEMVATPQACAMRVLGATANAIDLPPPPDEARYIAACVVEKIIANPA